MSKDFYAAVKERRSYYAIGKDEIVSKKRIEEVVEEAVLHSPSAFNSQSSRAVVLFGENHEKLWHITIETLQKVVPTDAFANTREKINSFAAGYGTILYFEDEAVVEGLQKSYPLYKDNFPVWSSQANGILQYVVWTALEVEGLGASLQHYNPLIDDEVKAAWDIPKTWKLIAQMPFGKPMAAPDSKQFNPISERVKTYG